MIQETSKQWKRQHKHQTILFANRNVNELYKIMNIKLTFTNTVQQPSL